MKTKEQNRNIYIGVAIVVILSGFLILKTKNDTASENVISPAVIQTTNPSSEDLMKGMYITVPETNFTVNISKETGNTVSFGDVEKNPEAGFGSVTVLPEFTAKVGGKNYITILAVNTGGSGEFFYLAYFEPEKDRFKMTGFAPLADRIKMTGVSASKDQITVNYMDHGPEQAMVDDPNVPVVKVYTVNNGVLTEVYQ